MESDKSRLQVKSLDFISFSRNLILFFCVDQFGLETFVLQVVEGFYITVYEIEYNFIKSPLIAFRLACKIKDKDGMNDAQRKLHELCVEGLHARLFEMLCTTKPQKIHRPVPVRAEPKFWECDEGDENKENVSINMRNLALEQV